MTPEPDELIAEIQDLRILKNILSTPSIATEFFAIYDEQVFGGDCRPFAKAVLNYWKAYRATPTKRVMTDHFGSEKFDQIYELIEDIDVVPAEFKYDLDKIKNRFAIEKIQSLKVLIDDSSNLEQAIKGIQVELDHVKRVKDGKKQTYIQRTLRSYMPDFKRNYAEKVKNPEFDKGLSTGYSYFDYLTGGLRNQEMLIVAGETSSGKMLPLDTPIPTPDGFKSMGDIHPGDKIFGRDGNIYSVLAESEVQTEPGWKFIFDDGVEIVSHDNHLWLTYELEPKGIIKDTARIVKEFQNSSDVNLIPLCEPLELPTKQFSIRPAILGAWLASFEDINCSVPFSFWKKIEPELKQLNVMEKDRIPYDYLWGSRSQRVELLNEFIQHSQERVAQWFNTGNKPESSSFSFKINKQQLVDDLVQLIRSLGIFCSVKENNDDSWIITIEEFLKFRFITNVERTSSMSMKCIQVDSPDNLYLAGDGFIPTHNSLLLNNIAIQLWQQQNTIDSTEFTKGHNVLYFSLEMPYVACFRRTMARLADVPLYGMRDAKLNKFQVANLNKVDRFIKNYPNEFQIVDIPRGTTIETIEQRFVEACNEFMPDVVVVDYLGLMEDHTAEGDDWLKLGVIAGKLHEFARAFNVIMITAVQLNRYANKTKDSSDAIGNHRIGRSSLITHHAPMVIQIETRKDERNYPDMRCHIIKNRDGALGVFSLEKHLANGGVKDIAFIPDEFATVESTDVDDITSLMEKHLWSKT